MKAIIQRLFLQMIPLLLASIWLSQAAGSSPQITPQIIESCATAIIEGDLEEAKHLLQTYPALINTPNPRTAMTPLSIAIFHDKLDMVKLLLSMHADANYQSSNGIPVFIGVHSVEVAKALVAHGADPKVVSSNGTNALMASVFGGVDPRTRLLWDYLLAQGIDVDAVDSGRTTALGRCTTREAALYLIAKGAKPNGPEGSEPPIYNLIGTDSAEVVKVLLEHGADPNGAGRLRLGQTPLQLAEGYHRTEIVRLLRQHGAH